MSAELLRQAAAMERAEWGDRETRRVFPKASLIHLALAAWLDRTAARVEEVWETISSERVREDATPGIVLGYSEAVALARLIVGEDA